MTKTIMLEEGITYTLMGMDGYSSMERHLDVAYFTYKSNERPPRQWYEVSANVTDSKYYVVRIFDCIKPHFERIPKMEFKK